MKQRAIKKVQRASALEHGVNLDVPGRAIIAQADERIKWHRHMATVMAAEVKAMTLKPGALEKLTDWKEHARRTDMESRISGHLEYARFLTFVRKNIVRDRRYRLGLSDMSFLEIMPKGSYC